MKKLLFLLLFSINCASAQDITKFRVLETASYIYKPSLDEYEFYKKEDGGNMSIFLKDDKILISNEARSEYKLLEKTGETNDSEYRCLDYIGIDEQNKRVEIQICASKLSDVKWFTMIYLNSYYITFFVK
jgi:hypothetical protein